MDPQLSSLSRQICVCLSFLMDQIGIAQKSYLSCSTKRCPFLATLDVLLTGPQVLQYGGVPFRPKFVVNREHLVEQVRNALVKVSQEAGSSAVAGVVVVRGMVGSGKSILAAEALRSPSLLSKWFPDGVYWIGIGNLREPRDVLLKMHLQLDRVSPHQHREATTVEIATSRLRHWSINKKASPLYCES